MIINSLTCAQEKKPPPSSHATHFTLYISNNVPHKCLINKIFMVSSSCYVAFVGLCDGFRHACIEVYKYDLLSGNSRHHVQVFSLTAPFCFNSISRYVENKLHSLFQPQIYTDIFVSSPWLFSLFHIGRFY